MTFEIICFQVEDGWMVGLRHDGEVVVSDGPYERKLADIIARKMGQIVFKSASLALSGARAQEFC